MNVEDPILKEGFMVKKGHIRHNWKSRWFVLHTKSLLYFKTKGDVSPKGMINLRGCSVISPDPEYTKKDCVFRLIEILGTEYLLQSSSEVERDAWVKEIGLAIRKLDSSLAKSNSLKTSNRPTIHSPPPSPSFERKGSNSPLLVVLQNRVTHQDLMDAMQDSDAGIALKNHHIGNDVYKLCFSGDDLVSWLISWSFVKTREEGRIIAGELLEEVYLHPVGPVSEIPTKSKFARRAFCDTTNALYRFSTISINSGKEIEFDLSDSSDESENEDEQIVDDLQKEILKQGFLVKKGHVRHNWKVRKFVLYDESARLSYYSPLKAERKGRKGRIKLSGSEVSVLNSDENKEDTSCVKGGNRIFREHCFRIRTKKGMKHVLQAPTREEAIDWVKVLQKVIANYNKL